MMTQHAHWSHGSSPRAALAMATRTPWRAVAVLAGLVLMLAGGPAPARAESPADVFLESCARCHGETGKADMPMSRTLKVAPLVHDARLARMTPAQIAQLIRSDPKHAGVVELRGLDLESAAVFVKKLAGARE